MKRRLFLKSLALKGIALPSAYLLSPALRAAGATETADDQSVEGRGCGRDDRGGAKPDFHAIVRDFHDPHLELVRLLKEASEIEHSLMIQYLFGAFTLKPKYQALVGPPVPSSDGLMGIAIQEMQHLAAVNKLLVALGSSPNLHVQDYPQEPDVYPFPMSLERLTRASLARITYVESGRSSIPMEGPMTAVDQLLCDKMNEVLGPDTGLNHVAGVYEIIIGHLKSMAADKTLELDGLDDWLEQLEYISQEGELQHFRFFSELFLGRHPALAGPQNPWELPEDHPDFPSFFVPPNPTAFVGHENQIESEQARELAWLSDLHYWMVLMMLDLYYRSGRESLNAMAQVHMMGPLQSLGTKLATLGVGLPFDRLSLGYSPASDHAGNLQFIRRLSGEADVLVQKLRDFLPADYPVDLHSATLELIKSELAALPG